MWLAGSVSVAEGRLHNPCYYLALLVDLFLLQQRQRPPCRRIAKRPRPFPGPHLFFTLLSIHLFRFLVQLEFLQYQQRPPPTRFIVNKTLLTHPTHHVLPDRRCPLRPAGCLQQQCLDCSFQPFQWHLQGSVDDDGAALRVRPPHDLGPCYPQACDGGARQIFLW